jgi:hypothetical protein
MKKRQKRQNPVLIPHDVVDHWFLSVSSRDIRKDSAALIVGCLNYWELLDWGGQSSDRGIFLRLNMRFPETCAHLLTTYSKNWLFVFPQPNRVDVQPGSTCWGKPMMALEICLCSRTCVCLFSSGGHPVRPLVINTSEWKSVRMIRSATRNRKYQNKRLSDQCVSFYL